MVRILRSRTTTRQKTTFCEDCARVCTPGCRSQARLDHVHTQVMQHTNIR
jgi:hypothetical protein